MERLLVEGNLEKELEELRKDLQLKSELLRKR
jgi:hypothetical protein